jgi:hypothetical protein
VEDLKNLRNFCDKQIKKHPQLKVDIITCYNLCLDNIEEGESVVNEIELCLTNINYILNMYYLK